MSIRTEIIEEMARTVYVQAWASYMDEQGASYHAPGENLMNVAPSTPASAKKWARKLTSVTEKMNGAKIEKLYSRAEQRARAAAATGHHHGRKKPTPAEFGYCLAMESLGHGVGWSDDFPDHGYLVPHSEFYCDSERSCEGYVSDSEGLARRH